MKSFCGFALSVLAGVLVLCPAEALGSYHFWGISEVYSNSDGSVQFVEMGTSSGFEQFVGGHSFTSNANSLVLGSSFASSTQNKKFLMATPGYVALGAGPAPDFVFPVNNFVSTAGDTLTFVTAIGDGTFPAQLTFTGAQLPTDGIRSLSFNLTANATNSPTNFAGQTGSVPEPSAVAGIGLIAAASLLKRRRIGQR